MMKLVFVSAAAVLLSASFANADRLFIPNDNDHLEALSFALQGNGHVARQGALIHTSATAIGVWGAVMSTTAVMPVSRGFLLHTGASDQKLVENQYAR